MNIKGIITIIILIIAALFGYKACERGDITSAIENSGQQIADVANTATDAATGAANAAADTAAGAVGAAAGTAADALKKLGDFFKVDLPNGISLNIPKFGVENKLIGFINDGDIDSKTWFDFDRINFNTGSSALSTESNEQIGNIVSILKAFPNVSLKVGGYTDNTGSSEGNMALSQKRAEAVMAGLTAQGIDAGRLVAEGFGSENPIATNDTEEGRAQNRRISLRVTAK